MISHPGYLLVLAAVAAICGALSVIAPTLVLAAAVSAIFACIVLYDLAAGLAAFVVLSYFEFFLQIGSSGNTFLQPAGVLLAFAWVLRILQRDDRVPLLFRSHPLLGYAIAAFAAWGFLSILWAPDPGAAYSVVSRIAQGALILVIAFSAVRERRHLRWLVSAFIGGAAVISVVGLISNSSGERLRTGLGDPNELAAALVPALVLALFWLAATRAPVARWLLLSSAVLIALAVFETESRGGIVALGTAFVVAIVYAGPLRSRALIALLVVAALSVAYYGLVASPDARARITDYSATDSSGRSDLWAVALQVWRDHPFIGVGAGNFTAVEPQYAASNINVQRYDLVFVQPEVAHNTYLEALADLGIIGGLAFAGVIVGCLTVGVRAVRSFVRAEEFELEILGRGAIVATISMLAAIIFISALYEKELWLLLGLSVALSAVAARVTRSTARESVATDARLLSLAR